MTDPALEASERIVLTISGRASMDEVAVAAAREALKPIRAALDKHSDQYLHHPPGPDVTMKLLLLCEDTIAAIRASVYSTEELKR